MYDCEYYKYHLVAVYGSNRNISATATHATVIEDVQAFDLTLRRDIITTLRMADAYVQEPYYRRICAAYFCRTILYSACVATTRAGMDNVCQNWFTDRLRNYLTAVGTRHDTTSDSYFVLMCVQMMSIYVGVIFVIRDTRTIACVLECERSVSRRVTYGVMMGDAIEYATADAIKEYLRCDINTFILVVSLLMVQSREMVALCKRRMFYNAMVQKPTTEPTIACF